MGKQKSGDPAKEIARLLKESGAVLLRQNKHEIWQLPNGLKYTATVSASDRRAALNGLKILQRDLAKPRRR